MIPEIKARNYSSDRSYPTHVNSGWKKYPAIMLTVFFIAGTFGTADSKATTKRESNYESRNANELSSGETHHDGTIILHDSIDSLNESHTEYFSPIYSDFGYGSKEYSPDSFDSPNYVLGQNSMDYGRGYGFEEAHGIWGSVTMVDGNLEPLEEEIPYFDENSPTQVTAAVGAPAHIPCMVRNLGSKSISWMRNTDLNVLTVGSFTFVNDHRFSAHKDQVTGDWVLVLRQPQPSDSGTYICSVSTKPVKTHSVKLNVVVPSAEMITGKEAFLDYGSTLNLTCLIHYSPSPPEFVLWYHRDKLVNYGGRGKRIEVETVHSGTTTRSSLLVRNVTQWHSGRYACSPANARKVTAIVHVLKSETPAAMQTTTSGSERSYSDVAALFILCSAVGFWANYELKNFYQRGSSSTKTKRESCPNESQVDGHVNKNKLLQSLHVAAFECLDLKNCEPYL